MLMELPYEQLHKIIHIIGEFLLANIDSYDGIFFIIMLIFNLKAAAGLMTL